MVLPKYKDLIDHLYDGVYYVNRDKVITYWNQAATKMTGYTSEEMVGQKCSTEFLNHVSSSGVNMCETGCPIDLTLEDGKIREGNFSLRHKNGERITVSVRVSAVRDESDVIIGAAEVFSNNSSKVSAIEHLQQVQNVSFLDHLTGVLNRNSLETFLETKVADYRKHGWPFGLVIFDVDNFAIINDKYGHNTGDAVMRNVAKTLSTNTRGFDLIGRWEGKQFALILANVDPEYINEIANRMRETVENSYTSVGESKIHVTLSGGATIVNKGDTVESMLRRIQDLVQKAKEDGRNKIVVG